VVVGPFTDLLADVWREACRHPDIAASAANIAKLLVPLMPMELLLVRHIEKERASVETVGVGLESYTTPLLADRTDCSPAQMARLLAWCRQGDVTWRRHGGRLIPDLAPAVPLALQGDLLIGPLASAQGAYGLLLLLARAQHGFTPNHMKIFQALLEPFPAALENHWRWRGLTTLGRAAEADKQSLLRRLGRESLAETMIGADSGLRLVMGRVTLVSRSDVPVLLLGEPGSGKEVIARDPHAFFPGGRAISARQLRRYATGRRRCSPVRPREKACHGRLWP
jgi:transcriptional regulator with GAF, ATPase, and Fis domain